MLAILNSLNAHKFPIFQPIMMILVSKFMVQRPLSDKINLSLGLLSPLKNNRLDRILYHSWFILLEWSGIAGCNFQITGILLSDNYSLDFKYSKTCLKLPLKKKTKNRFLRPFIA